MPAIDTVPTGDTNITFPVGSIATFFQSEIHPCKNVTLLTLHSSHLQRRQQRTKTSGTPHAILKTTKRTKRSNQQSSTGDHHGCYHNQRLGNEPGTRQLCSRDHSRWTLDNQTLYQNLCTLLSKSKFDTVAFIVAPTTVELGLGNN